MRIAVVSPEFPPDIGGVETYALEYCKALVALGHKVTVYTKRHPEGELRIDGIEVKAVLRMRLHKDRQALADQEADAWHIMNAAYAWLVEDKPRLIASVHGNDFLRPYYPLAQPDWRRLPFGARFEDHQPSWFRPWWIKRTAKLLGRSLPLIRHILTNSRYTEQALLALYPGCAGHTSVGYVGVSEKFFGIERRPNADGLTRLLTVCRLSEPRKNVESVLRALGKLRHQFSFRYTIIGDGWDRARLEGLTQELGLTDRVHFAGFVSQEELEAHYAEADLFVLTSLITPNSHEGFGIAYLEAAASGVPCLAARLAGAAEAVKENVSGMFVEEPTTDAIERALLQFLNGSKRFDSQACRDFAHQFTWRAVVEQALPYYLSSGVHHGRQEAKAGLISVIMPCYNSAAFLDQAVGSVLNQSYANVELIVIDDGSTDDSVEILERMKQDNPGRIKLLFQQHQGPYPARNLGISQAEGEFIAFLDADDWWTPDCLEKLHSALEISNATLSYCGWQNVGASDRSNEPYVPPDYEQGDKAEQFLRAAAPWPIHAALTRRAAILAVGGFDTQWSSCMDYDLWLRIGVANPIVLVPEAMAFYRHKVSGQITSKQWVQAENSWLVKQKFVGTHPQLAVHLGEDKLNQLINGGLLNRGYQAYWRRDLVTSWHIFRKMLVRGGWKLKDLKYLLPALLPERAYIKLISALSSR